MTRAELPNILVVIPVLNESRTLEPIVRTLLRDPILGDNSSIVIADGGSTDGTTKVIQKLVDEHRRVLFLENPKRIQSAAVNEAVKTYGGNKDFLVRCDAHAVYESDFVSRLIATLERTGADSIVVPMDSVGRGCVQNAIAWVSDTTVGSGGAAHRAGKTSGFVEHGHHAAIRLDQFRRIGGYDETFSCNEDAEFDCRLTAFGGRIYLDAKIRIQYQPRASLLRLARQYFFYGFGRSRTMRRHPSSARLRQIAVPINFILLIASVVFAKSSKLPLVFPVAYAAALLVVSVSTVVKKRSTCGILAGVAALIMHNCWAAGFLCGFTFKRERRWQNSLPAMKVLTEATAQRPTKAATVGSAQS
jgi:succinoglycan biosynthesis protein ExoA